MGICQFFNRLRQHQASPPVAEQFITLNTTSASSGWTPSVITNSGATLEWEVTGGVTIAPQVIDKPIFNLSSNSGTATITVKSTTNFTGLTEFYVDNLLISTIDVLEATDLFGVSCKQTNLLTSFDISTLTDLEELTFRSDGSLTSIDISNNILLTNIWGYSTPITTLDVASNDDLIYLNLSNCSLTTLALDTIINDLDTNGASNGDLLLDGNPGLPLTSSSYQSYIDLVARGWTINVANSTPVDTQDPVVGTLTYANETSSTVELTCAATDNVAVTYFKIYLDTVLDRTVTTDGLVSYEFDGLSAGTNYDIYVVAYDAAGNFSSNSNTVNFTTDAATSSDGFTPVLSNFRIENSSDTRVYFDSLEIITASTGFNGYNGFTITDKTINQITINSGSLVNHYFTVTSAFDFYSNNTIRYEGGSDIADSDTNGVYDFTLQEIINNIDEPSTSSTYYVDKVTGDNGDNGTTEGLAWETITYAATQASAGDLIYIKAANYGAENITMSTSGNLANPIIFEGYTTTPGDSPSLTRELDLAFDSGVMPLLIASGSGNGIYASLESYIIIKNIQIENYDKCIYYDSNSYCILDNVYLKDATIALQMTANPSNYLRVINSYIADCTSNGMWNYGTNHLIKNTWAVSSRIVNMDYHIAYQSGATLQGYHIIKDCYIHSYWDDSHGDHAISLKGGPSQVLEYTLIEDCTIENNGQGIECRHEGAQRNVIRGCYGTRTPDKITATRPNAALVTFRDGCSNNIIEKCTFEKLNRPLLFNDNAGEEGIQPGGIDNIISNCLFKDNDYDIFINNGIGGLALEPTGNKFLNCTFSDSTKLIINGSVPFGSSNEFINCIIQNIPAYDTSPSFSYSNFYNSFAVPSGTGNNNDNPQLDSNYKLTFDSPATVTYGGTNTGTSYNIFYDVDGVERTAPYSMGISEYVYVAPVLSNFIVENATPTQVNFDADKDITGMTTTDFIISGKTISSLTIDGDGLGGYFTVSSAFDFWDNNTIRLDSDNVVYAFTLEYIVNNITEPTATTNTYYVTTTGNDSNDGLSEGNAWLTWQKAFTTATAGSTVWIKAGLYQGENVTGVNSGTATNPIKFIGYKTSIGDISSMYYAYGDGAMDSAEMPHLDGEDDTIDLHYGLEIIDKSFIIIENIQIDGYSRAYNGRHPNVILENCLMFGGDVPTSEFQGLAIVIQSESSTPTANSNNNRILNCLTLNGGVAGLQFAGNHNLVNGHKHYSDIDGQPSTDYYTHLSGSDNIVLNFEAHRIGNLSHTGHGIGIKDIGYTSEYNLFDNCLAVNIGRSYYVRWSKTKYNVFKNCEAYGYSRDKDAGNAGGISIFNSASYNTFENMYFHTMAYGIQFYYNVEDTSLTTLGNNNTFKNVIIDNAYYGIHTVVDRAGLSLDGTNFINCTFNNVLSLWRKYISYDSGMSNNLFTNCIFKDIVERLPSPTYSYQWDTTTDTSWEYNDFHTSWGTEGTNFITDNPLFTDIDNGDFTPQSTQVATSGSLVTHYDFNGIERTPPYSIGIIETDGTITIPSNELYDQDNAASEYVEENSVGAWWDHSGVGRTTLSVESSDVYDGNYAIKLVNETQHSGGDYPLIVTNGADYTVKIWYKNGTGDGGGFHLWEGFVTSPDQNVTSTIWTEYTFNVTANIDGIAHIRVYSERDSISGTQGDYVLIDKISITKQ